jgi:hypothetical protein
VVAHTLDERTLVLDAVVVAVEPDVIDPARALGMTTVWVETDRPWATTEIVEEETATIQTTIETTTITIWLMLGCPIGIRND